MPALSVTPVDVSSATIHVPLTQGEKAVFGPQAAANTRLETLLQEFDVLNVLLTAHETLQRNGHKGMEAAILNCGMDLDALATEIDAILAQD